MGMEERRYRGSELFTLRVWAEDIGVPPQQLLEWRGKLQHVAHDTTWYFLGWQALVDLLQTHAAGLAQSPEQRGGSSGEDREQQEEQVRE